MLGRLQSPRPKQTNSPIVGKLATPHTKSGSFIAERGAQTPRSSCDAAPAVSATEPECVRGPGGESEAAQQTGVDTPLRAVALPGEEVPISDSPAPQNLAFETPKRPMASMGSMSDPRSQGKPITWSCPGSPASLTSLYGRDRMELAMVPAGYAIGDQELHDFLDCQVTAHDLMPSHKSARIESLTAFRRATIRGGFTI